MYAENRKVKLQKKLIWIELGDLGDEQRGVLLCARFRNSDTDQSRVYLAGKYQILPVIVKILYVDLFYEYHFKFYSTL